MYIISFSLSFLVPSKLIPPDEIKCLLPPLYACLEDRNLNVRNASEKVVLGVMMHLGYSTMYGACEKLKVYFQS